MHYIRLIVSITTIAFIFISCHKENITNIECKNLKESIQASDKEGMTDAVGHLLTSYSKDNLEKFVIAISSECSISATLLCYDCIYTFPSESEIKISFTMSNISIEKIVDVSHDDNNRMVIVRLHD